MKNKHSIIKMIAVTLLATYITYLLGITNYLSAGILAMISIQKTKRLSIRIASIRAVLVFISMILSVSLFVVLGYNFIAYSLFIITIVVLSAVTNLQDGTIPSVVVVTHLFVLGEFSMVFLFETALMYTITVSIALLFNLFYPSESYNALEDYRSKLDNTIKEHLVYLKDKMESQERTCAFTTSLEQRIEDILEKINQITGDLIMKNHQDILNYSIMRSKQFDILKNICIQSDKLHSVYPQTKTVINYLDSLSNSIGVKDYASSKLEEIDRLLLQFKDEPLPLTREEFEHRAILYYITLQIRQFLKLKITYHNQNKKALVTELVR